MVANQLRTVFNQTLPRLRAVLADGATSQIRVVFEVWVVASKYEDEGRSPDDGAESYDRLPFREAAVGRPVPMTPIEARAEVRDRETYYAELRFAVHCQSRSIPLPRAALDDQETDSSKRRRPDDESWDDMTARFGDTWT
jgi:hypothetical protein